VNPPRRRPLEERGQNENSMPAHQPKTVHPPCQRRCHIQHGSFLFFGNCRGNGFIAEASSGKDACDVKALTLFKIQPSAIAHIQLAQKWGLGTADFSKLTRYQAVL